MPLNIPMPQLPLSGLNQAIATGGNLFQQMINPVIQRENMQRQWKQHLDSLELQKAAEGRSAQLFPYHLQELKDKHAAAQFERNMMDQLLGNAAPQSGATSGGSNYTPNGYPALNELFSGKGMFNQGIVAPGNIDLSNRPIVPNPETGGESTVYSMSIGTPQGEVLIPRVSDDGRILSEQEAIDQYKNTGKHLGVYSNKDEANKAAKKIHQQQEQQMNQQKGVIGNNPLLNKLMQNPMMRGWFKHKFGYDPLAPVAQTPEQKKADQLDLFKEKEEYKAQQEAKLPAAIKTLHENIIHLSPKAIDAIQHIIDIPSPFEPWGFGAIKSGQKAAHKKLVTAAAENYAKAKGWPNTRGSIDKAESILERGNFETDFDYHKRLYELQNELKSGIESSNKFLHPNKKKSESDNNVVEYERIGGKLVRKKGK